MPAKSSSDKQGGRTFIESARRAQIVDAAIEVIADQGYAGASFAKIAKQAGLSSTGMISYHFKGKDDLIREVVAEVLRVNGEFLLSKMDTETSILGRLRLYITTRVALLDEYPKHQRALQTIVNAVQTEDPELRGLAPAMAAFATEQEKRIRLGQRQGEIRELDPLVLVLAVNGALDQITNRAAVDPDFDTAACARELADLFDRAVRKQ
ncbi:TetR/AcrR family transcriptional regulator [Amycolatopsis sp. NPDC059021]|uniref:TetR/AcrR family transcriptional regulator n=1 Tax=Amycolatopsis sp. NPDC059021 TaxID=3346704 RepID=UPI00366CD0C6